MDLLYRSAKQRHRDNARILTNIAQNKRNRELAKQTTASSFNTTSSTTTPPSTTSLTSTTNSLILKGIENFSGTPDLRDHFNAARLSFEDTRALISQYLIEKMDAIKAGIEKAKETVQGKKAEEEARKASDPTVKPSERVDAAVEYGKAKMKEAEHACKAECNKDKHVCH
ncbi:unnamed protein product [Rotaria sordida]|uniref:Uncharacterized protein n=1 Tax=Rotaria sordida TaxID=392033 RepID=A0A814K389_9BILA|nr:unnamed protein product [Rotaria sordida]CAF1202428.1 unnamed protein product [Rotaria sordida]